MYKRRQGLFVVSFVAIALCSAPALARLHCHPSSKFTIFADKDAPGTNYKELDGVASCEDACAHDLRLTAFSYETPGLVRFLKNAGKLQLTEHQGAAGSATHQGSSKQPIDSALRERIESFVKQDFLGGDLSSASHLQAIYAESVHYFDKGQVPVSTVILDKIAYAEKWPDISYELKPESLVIDRVSDKPSTYKTQFDVGNGVTNIKGVGKSELILDLSGSDPKITSEKGETLSRQATQAQSTLEGSARDGFKALTHHDVVGRCHMNACWWFSIETTQKMGSSSRGVLYAIATKNWEADCNDSYTKCGKRKGGEEQILFVFCSKRKPAMIDNYDGKWNATLLEPGNSNAIFGATEGGYAMYWAACHGVAVQDVYKDGDRLARALGYPFRTKPNDDSSDQAHQTIDLSSPFDVLNW